MKNLFDEEIPQQNPAYETGKALKIIPAAKQKLSAAQHRFNALAGQIENLKKAINNDKAKFDKLLKYHTEQMAPAEKKAAEAQVQLAEAIAAKAEAFKLGKLQKQKAGRVISELCMLAFEAIDPDEKLKTFFDSWSDRKFDDIVAEQKSDMQDFLNMQVHEAFGDDFDIEIPDINSTEEELARFAKNLQDRMKILEEEEEERHNNRKRTRKQAEREALEKQQKDARHKSMRDIYIGLAKILHPDTDTDPAERQRKEEQMKKLTAAYKAKDLTTLLKLEMQWISSETGLDSCGDEKLDLYISVLAAQAEELKNEREMQQMHPRYQNIWPYRKYTEKQALKRMKDEMLETENEISDSHDIEKDVEGYNKKEFVEFTENYIMALEYQQQMEDIEDFFNYMMQ